MVTMSEFLKSFTVEAKKEGASISHEKKEEDDNKQKKILRDAFLYMDPKPPSKEFGQCETCFMWVKDADLCTIHGKSVEIDGDDSCSLYVHGKPVLEKDSVIRKLVTAEESGLIGRDVRCENCKFFNKGDVCGLFDRLNKEMPDIYDLDVKVLPYGCCNGQLPK